jgi:hypothetical protein
VVEAPGSGSAEQPPAPDTENPVTAGPGLDGALPGTGSGEAVAPEPPAPQPLAPEPLAPAEPSLEPAAPALPALPPVPEPPAVPQAPSPAPPAGQGDLLVEGQPLIPEAPVITWPSADVVEDEPLSAGGGLRVDVQTAGSQDDSIVMTRRDGSPPKPPSLVPSRVGSELAASPSDRRRPESGSHSETRRSTPPAVQRSTGPLLPPLFFGDGAPSTPYVSGGGPSGASAGGVFAWALAGMLALLVAAQRLGGVVRFKLAPPRCAAFVGFPERPD